MANNFPGFIAHVKRYVPLNEQDVATIESCVEPLELKRRELLVTNGQVCRCNYFVEAGCLRMFYMNDKLVEQTTQFALETWWLSDYFSFVNQTPTLYTIQAVEKSFVIAIDSRQQERLLFEVPQMERYFRIMMQRALAASQLRVKLIYEYSKEEMYTHFVTSYPQFFQRVPQYMIASYLGLTPEYLSELRKKR
jgi:CRP/FNR family transcriptional regulator, anaerobic regulatory protein